MYEMTMATTEPAMPMNVRISMLRDSQPLRAPPMVPRSAAIRSMNPDERDGRDAVEHRGEHQADREEPEQPAARATL
jgi:hypothetical protein